MEEPVERKDAAVGIAAEEPLKTEGIVPSPDTSERSEGASSPPPNCSICLGKLRNTSFTDSCLHQFCFTCLLQWSKIKTECPLCKQTFKSIIHNVRSEEDYDQYHVPRELASQLPTQQIASLGVNNFELVNVVEGQFRRIVYRTTMTPNRRYGVLLNPEQVARREQIPNMMPPAVSREERRFRRVNPTGYRRNVYQLGEWSNFLPDIHGRLRECSAEYYRRHPNEINRLIPWINRELQILLNANETHIAYVLNIITDALPAYDIRGPEFRDTVRPYFGPYTDHFAHELLNYARTSFDLVGYDQYVTYPTRGRGLSGEYVGRVISPESSTSSTSSDDSDVRVVDQTTDVSRIGGEVPSVGPHVIDMPGPSTVSETFQVPRMTSGPDILTISSSSSSTDDCEVVGYVKPRHERTPEVIELESSDGGAEATNSRDAGHSTVCESRENDCDRAGPSHEERRRGSRKSSRQCRSSIVRWWRSSGSSTNEESDIESAGRYRKKSSHRGEVREASRKTPRVAEEIISGERAAEATHSRSETRRRQGSSSSSSLDLNSRKSWRRGVRDRVLEYYAIKSCLHTCDSDDGNGGGSSSSSSDKSSSSSSIVRKVCKVKDSKDQAPKKGIYSSSSCSPSTSSSSSSSSDSGSVWSGASATHRRKRQVRSRRKVSLSCQASGSESTLRRRRNSQQQQQQQQPVNATILRKDSSKPNEWYVTKKRKKKTSTTTTSHCRSRSRSSSSRPSEPRRMSIDEYRERKESGGPNPGCSRNGERKGGSTKSKRLPDVSSSASESNSDETIASNSRASGISGRTRAKERSKHRDVPKRRRIISASSDSGRSRPVGGGSSGRRRDQESRSDQAKRKEQAKRSESGRKKERTSKTGDQGKKGDQAKRNDRDRNNDHANRDEGTRKKGESSKNHDQERNTNDQARKNGDQARKNTDHERKSNDQDRKNNDQARKNTDQERKYSDQERKTDSTRKHADHERKSNDQERKNNDQTCRSNGARKKERRIDNDDDEAGTSRHSENEKRCSSKDKHKRKKKQKVKRRRSRSESKAESRNSRHRMERSSSYSAPTSKRDDP